MIPFHSERHPTKLYVFTIFKSPEDYPGKYVARRFLLDQPLKDIRVCETLEEVRGCIPPGLVLVPRAPDDPSVVVECWL